MRGNEAVRRALAHINVRILWGMQAAHWRTQIAEHDVHAYAPVGALVGALVPPNAWAFTARCNSTVNKPSAILANARARLLFMVSSLQCVELRAQP